MCARVGVVKICRFGLIIHNDIMDSPLAARAAGAHASDVEEGADLERVVQAPCTKH